MRKALEAITIIVPNTFNTLLADILKNLIVILMTEGAQKDKVKEIISSIFHNFFSQFSISKASSKACNSCNREHNRLLFSLFYCTACSDILCRL